MMAISFVLRPWARISKTFLLDVRNVLRAHIHDLAAKPDIILLLKSALIKVGDKRRAVMLLDDVDNLRIEFVLKGKVHTLLDVSDYY